MQHEADPSICPLSHQQPHLASLLSPNLSCGQASPTFSFQSEECGDAGGAGYKAWSLGRDSVPAHWRERGQLSQPGADTRERRQPQIWLSQLSPPPAHHMPLGNRHSFLVCGGGAGGNALRPGPFCNSEKTLSHLCTFAQLYLPGKSPPTSYSGEISRFPIPPNTNSSKEPFRTASPS